jgi:hypothetical protein
VIYIAKQYHVNRQNCQLLDDGVANCLVGEVHARLEDRKRWFRANGISSYFQVFLDAPDVFVGAVGGLLDNRLCVSAEVLDKAFL